MEGYKKRLMSKNGRVTVSLAKELLVCQAGDRIETVGAYSERFDTGRGTIQSAFKFLQSERALSLESKGHLGTYILWIDHKKLWEIADIGTIMCVMPLPYSKRYEGLATGLYKAFQEANIPFSLAFMRGATKRIEALNMGKYNFTIVSKLAASLEMKRNDKAKILYEFKEESYVGNHVIIFRDKRETKIRDGMRVALDPVSIDQLILTNYECEGIDVEYVETSYNQILQKLENNEIDAAIWNGDELNRSNFDFNVSPLSNPKTKKISKDDTIAVILINKEYDEFGDIFQQFINLDKIEQIQHEVMAEKIIPMY